MILKARVMILEVKVVVLKARVMVLKDGVGIGRCDDAGGRCGVLKDREITIKKNGRKLKRIRTVDDWKSQTGGCNFEW